MTKTNQRNNLATLNPARLLDYVCYLGYQWQLNTDVIAALPEGHCA